MLGALELDRQMKRKLESTNYSILQNFDVFQHPYCTRPHKHYSDVEQLKKFLQHIPYLKEITEGMSMRLVEKIIHQLSLKFLPANCQCDSQFQIMLSGEIQIGQRTFVQTDTINEVGSVLRDSWVLILSNEGYNDLIREYHENLMAHKLHLIQQYSVFNKISIQRLKNQLDQFKQEQATNNTILYQEKQPVDSFYLVVQGEVKLVQEEIELQLLGPKSVFGEMELVEGNEFRYHKAVVTQQISYYRIGYHQLKILLNSSGLYETFCQNYHIKAQFWKARKQQCKKEVIIPIDYSEFKYDIPKTYHNYLSASKLLKYAKQNTSNPEDDYKETKEDKLLESYKKFNHQIKLNFKQNHLLRKVLIQAKQTNHDLPIMKGLQLERYLPKNHFTHKKSLKIISQFNETAYQRFVSDIESYPSTTTFVKGSRLFSAASRLQSPASRLQSAAPKLFTSPSKLQQFRPITAIKRSISNGPQ
ncbi:unnamed protein product (macronuclear) [Paramecium tetraurelia]|uniref:Cyclic nucleotide-binding domain-containing protein n=1 Tax=Paramecium tetraurelia TaxID=5888 RepID=A0CAH0_PARTE|nr:uncharacterized protein GSPATT00036567001 [Paramecium tetraurelia]CAK67787.1 unnamed protein product [Paramecium tetraurelia]|eukprot:XP_001435184.1 hypothetical protein (macronuclear) [Paramecium tetraurelia strain d4-2]